jgi:hypothetical protein
MRTYIHVYKLRITLAIHSHGRLFSLTVEWIKRNPGKGNESATPLYRGLLCAHGQACSNLFVSAAYAA